jgi:hypothetical protein
VSFDTLPWPAVIVSIVVVFVSGLTWFSRRGFFPAWWSAMGKGEGDVPGVGQSMPVVFGLTLVGIVIQAVAMALVVGLAHDALGDVDLLSGISLGLVVGLAVSGAALGHRLFAGHGLRVWLLEVGNDLLNFVLMGLIYAIWL